MKGYLDASTYFTGPGSKNLSPYFPKQRKTRRVLLTGFKRSQLIFPFCVIYVSKLSGFGGSGERGGVMQCFPAGSYHGRLLWCRHQGGSHLYHLCCARPGRLCTSGVTTYVLTRRTFDVHKEALWRARSSRQRRPLKKRKKNTSRHTLNKSNQLFSLRFSPLLSPHLFRAKRRPRGHSPSCIYTSTWWRPISPRRELVSNNLLLFSRPTSSRSGWTDLLGETLRDQTICGPQEVTLWSALYSDD